MRTILDRLYEARRAVLLYAMLLGLGWLFGDWLKDFAVPDVRPLNEPSMNMMVNTAILVFVLAAAIPFVPGAEIGFALLILFGGVAAPAVYVSMVGALILSFAVARSVPPKVLANGLAWLGLNRASQLVSDITALPPNERAATLETAAPGRIGKFLIRQRYIALALLLNMPGNSALGGGGGLEFLAGLSGVFSTLRYVLTVLIAVLPIPLVFMLFM